MDGVPKSRHGQTQGELGWVPGLARAAVLGTVRAWHTSEVKSPSQDTGP